MSFRRIGSRLSQISKRRNDKKRQRSKATARQNLVQKLEDRNLLAGPELIAIRPDAGALLEDGDVLKTAPRDFNLLFRGGADLDESSISSNSVQLVRSGGDGTFSDGNEIDVAMGYIGLQEPGQDDVTNLQQIVFRPASDAAFNANDPAVAMPDDWYQIRIVGTGANPLQNRGSEAFNDGLDLVQSFRLDRGAQVVSVIPQPISRDGNGNLQQASNEIVVHFDDQPLDQEQAEDPKFYRLTNTEVSETSVDDTTILPQTVSYDSNTNTATLTFAQDIPEGTFRLDIGQPLADDNLQSNAVQVGTLFEGQTFVDNSFLGDASGVSDDATDVDYYEVNVLPGDDLSIGLFPSNAELQLEVVLTNQSGVEIATAGATAPGAVLNYLAGGLAGGNYFLQVRSVGAASTGAYRLDLSTTGTNVSTNNSNSSTQSATQLGTLGKTTVQFSRSINNSGLPNVLLPPGANDEPGHRNLVENDDHVNSSSEGIGPVAPQAIQTRYYYFPDTLGDDPLGNPYPNLITESEKQIARQIFEIYAKYSGWEFIEAVPSNGPTQGGRLAVGKGDTRSIVPDDDPNGGTSWGGPGFVVMNGNVWDNSNRFFGDSFTNVLIHELGHALELPHAYGLPATMGQQSYLNGAAVYPGDHDLAHIRRQQPLSSNDIDLYQFDVSEPGTLELETIAERLSNPSLLNSALQLFRQDALTGELELVAQNDQYFGSDSYISVPVNAGTYFVGVSSTGNTNYDPQVENSGSNGSTQGDYELRLSFSASSLNGSLTDTSGTALDGDQDGAPGGVHRFWFQSSDTDTSIYVDKTNLANNQTGSTSNPFSRISDALTAAGSRLVIPSDGGDLSGESFTIDDGDSQITFTFGGGTTPINPTSGSADEIAEAIEEAIVNSALNGVTATIEGRVVQLSGVNDLNLEDSPTLLNTPNLVQIVGNGGLDGNVDTIADNQPYLIGDDVSGFPLEDGADFLVPQGVTAMLHAGALLKMRKANLDAGTSSAQVSRKGSAIQILGTPERSVFLRSYHDDTAGGNSDGLNITVRSGDFGGIVMRDDSDLEDHGIFLNHINHADIKHGGGKVVVESEEAVYNPVNIIDARPTVSFNYIWQSADSAMSATPNSFAESFYTSAGVDRIGPDIDGNYLRSNTIDGLYIRVSTEFGSSIEKLTESARFDDTSITHILTENLLIDGAAGGPVEVPGGALQARIAGRLTIDPGTVLKLSDARIETERGAGALIAEGTVNRPIVFTSLGDDRFGGSGSFDSNNTPNSSPNAGDWGGLYFGHMTSASLDHAIIAYGGGLSPIEGGDATFGAIEIHQAWARIANTEIYGNGSGADNSNRGGRGPNSGAAIYIRGAQPILVDNIVRDNASDAMTINANAMRFENMRDPGRATGLIDRYAQFDDNRGPLIRLNALENNQTNGLEIIGQTLTTETVWDDTDIVHVLRNEIVVGNHHTYSGLTLQSSNTESLIVKLAGNNAGFTATGKPLDIHDRIGGTVHVLGAVGHPVVLTHLSDDSVGAGYTPSGAVAYNTNNSANPSTGNSGGWRGLRFDEFSNDRNVAIERELENPLTTGNDINDSTYTSQFLGTLAPDETGGDETRRLGFEVNGFISPDDSTDGDVYSFEATPGTGVWLDIDRTDMTLDAVIEVLSPTGTVLARSIQNGVTGALSDNEIAGELDESNLTQNPVLGVDHYSSNIRDPGMFYQLPGSSALGTYFVRISSLDGESSGEYSLQIRARQVQEFPGSTVRYADIRYASTGIDVRGLPAHSLLTGDAGELNNGGNNTAGGAEQLVNLLETDLAAINLGGSLSSHGDVDFYRFEVAQVDADNYGSDPRGLRDNTVGVVFDIDYSAGAVRGDTTIAVFNSDLELIYIGRDSNIADDQSEIEDLRGGSLSVKDAYIGPVHLSTTAEGNNNYFVAVMSSGTIPATLNGVFNRGGDALTRLEPVNSVERVIEDHIGSQGYVSNGEEHLPTGGALLDVETSLELDTHVTPFTFSDVALYLTTDVLNADTDALYTVDPFTGGEVTTVAGDFGGAVNPYTPNSRNDYQDIVMRSDGTLWAYQRVADNINQVGNLVQLNPDDGSVISSQADNIPSSAQPTVSINDFSELATTDWVDALAWERNGTNNYDLYYSVRENSTDNLDLETESWRGGITENSKLYRANPNNGSAAEAANQPWGEKGDIQPEGVTFASRTIRVSDANAPSAQVRIESKVPGSNGEFTLQINENDIGNNSVSVNRTTGTLTLNIDNNPNPTAGAIASLINNSAEVRKYFTANVTTQTGFAGAGEQEDTDGALALQSGPSTNAFDGSVNAANGLAGPLEGRVTGLAFGGFSSVSLFGVTRAGEFLEINKGSGQVQRRFDFGLTSYGELEFEGLALGPQNVEGGRLKDVLFAVTRSGEMFAIDLDAVNAATDLSDAAQIEGILQTEFDSTGDGLADATSINLGRDNAVGLAFSPLDFNLWHTSNHRGNDSGHGINAAPDDTRDASGGGTSLYFGLEQYQNNTTEGSDYNQFGVNRQYGILTAAYHQDLTSNPVIGDNINLPGGGYGTMTTNTFSLADWDYHDRPTLYFNYFLDTDAGDGDTQDVDRARVFISEDGGDWELLTTNNDSLNSELPSFLSQFSDAGKNRPVSPVDLRESDQNQLRQVLQDGTGQWRQARVDLSSYAKTEDNAIRGDLRLRFEFSTAGTTPEGGFGTGGELTNNNRSVRSNNNNHEGFFIDDIIIGFAERGEMVTGANSDAGTTTVPVDPSGFNNPAFGQYQLEIRRTEDEYITEPGSPNYSVTSVFDTNVQHIVESSTVNPNSSEIDADRNRERAQGMLILESNFIRDSATVGINIEPGVTEAGGNVPHVGPVIQFPQLNAERLVPGVVVENNVIVGGDGVRFAGANGTNPNLPVPQARIVNNTFVGADQTGIGINVSGQASPTIMNNVFNDLNRGITNGGTGSVIRTNFFQDNANNGNAGTVVLQGGNGDPLFIDRANGNYILVSSSLAVDSSQEVEQDRLNYVNFKRELGIPESPIFAPDRDIYGQLRVDSSAGPGGNGNFVDRGATDVSDFEAPFAFLLNPVDNDIQGADLDPELTTVMVADPIVENFRIQLGDGPDPSSPFEGTGVNGLTVLNTNDPTVAETALTITRNGVPLEQGIDYSIAFNELIGELRITPLATLWERSSIYIVTLNNDQIADKAGNHLRSNQVDGETRFTIIIPPVEIDFGDAPDTYRTLNESNGARHISPDRPDVFLGTEFDSNEDGQPGPNADGDDNDLLDDDDGLSVGSFVGDVTTTGLFLVDQTLDGTASPAAVVAFLNRNDAAGAILPIVVTGGGVLDAWVDFNADGDFLDPGEKIITGRTMAEGVNQVRVFTPPNAVPGMTYARFRLSDEGITRPDGMALGGEVEDYHVNIVNVDVPVPQNDSYSVSEDNVLVVNGDENRSLFDNGEDSIPDDQYLSPEVVIDATFDENTGLYRTQFGHVRLDDAAQAHFTYFPNLDFEGTDTFRYAISTQRNEGQEFLDSANFATVSIEVEPFNANPIFNIPTSVEIWEDETTSFTIEDFFTGVLGGDPDLYGEDERQQDVTFSIELQNETPTGLMAGLPDVSTGSSITFDPTMDFSGEAIYVVTATDDGTNINGGPTLDPQSTSKTFTVTVHPVNDAPRFDPAVAGTNGQPDAADDPFEDYGWEVANVVDITTGFVTDASITYTMPEDGTQAVGQPEEALFIPARLAGGTGANYAPIGLVDVFNVGPDDEASDVPYGNQTLPLLDVPATTTLGGTLTPGTKDIGGQTVDGYFYVPPTDQNNLFNTPLDSFVYTVTDDGLSFRDGALTDEPQSSSNTVFLNMVPINDQPTFNVNLPLVDSNDPSGPRVPLFLTEDSPKQIIPGFVFDILTGPTTAEDELRDQTTILSWEPGANNPLNEAEFFLDGLTLEQDGTLTFQPNTDVYGSYEFVILMKDTGVDNEARGDVHDAESVTVTITVLAVNDPPRFNPDVTGTGLIENPNDADAAYEVAEEVDPATGLVIDGTITYRLKEDNTLAVDASKQSYFIPLRRDPNIVGYNPFGLLDVFVAGPENEIDPNAAAGGQTVSLVVPPTTTEKGGTIEVATVNNVAGVIYTPPTDYNRDIDGPDSFVYEAIDNGTDQVIDGTLIPNALKTANTVVFDLTPVNDAPLFSVDLPAADSNDPTGPLAPLEALEDSATTTLPGFVFDIFAGPAATATDELASQDLTLTLIPNDPSAVAAAFAELPELTQDGQLSFKPAVDYYGDLGFTITLVDNGLDDATSDPDRGDRNEAVSVSFTISILPVNDAPRLDPAELVGLVENPANLSDDAYSVSQTDGSITYTLKEDNTQPVGSAPEPYFFPLRRPDVAGYNPVGLIDVFVPGPQNEIDGLDEDPGAYAGDQSLSLHSLPPTTALGGTLELGTKDGIDGVFYTPPVDYNNQIGIEDSFVYEVIDDGTSKPINDVLQDDFRISSNTVSFNLTAVNDQPLFDVALPLVDSGDPNSGLAPLQVLEDTDTVTITGFVNNILAGPDPTASDELLTQTLDLTLTPTNPIDVSAFFDEVPTLTQDGTLSFKPAFDVYGDFEYVINLQDSGDDDPIRGDERNADTATFTISVLPVNDAPRFVPEVTGTSNSNGDDDQYSVNEQIDDVTGLDLDGTINLTLKEDNTPAVGDAFEPYFIPFYGTSAGTNDDDEPLFNPLGLFDVFTAGPLNELDPNAYAGNQTIGLQSMPTATELGGTLELGSIIDGNGLEVFGVFYTPPVDYNLDIGEPDSFVYSVIDDGRSQPIGGSLQDDFKASQNTVSLTMTPVNDQPLFDVNLPLVDSNDPASPYADIRVLEDSTQTVIPDLVTGMQTGPDTATDELENQTAELFLTPMSYDPADEDNFFADGPTLGQDGSLTFTPAIDAFGVFEFVIDYIDSGDADDARGDQNTADAATITITVLPVNDGPRVNTEFAGEGQENGDDDQWAVGGPSDPNGFGVISYTLREDVTPAVGEPFEPFFIPFRRDQSIQGFNRLGLIDALTVGPDNEAAPDVHGGDQTLSIDVPTETQRGGTLVPMTVNGVEGVYYTPPLNYNNIVGIPDVFEYTVTDNGGTYQDINGTLISDPLSYTNAVILNLNDVNDEPQFIVNRAPADPSNPEAGFQPIEVLEDSSLTRVNSFAVGIHAAPPLSAFDEVDALIGQNVFFDVAPRSFLPTEMSQFFNVAPAISPQGNLTFEPAADVFGEFVFQVQLLDNGERNPERGDDWASQPATITINILPVNDSPVLVDGAATIEITEDANGNEILEDPIDPIFIPARTTGNQVGLLDVFAPGPDNESSDITPGGNQSVSFDPILPQRTVGGGTLTPEFDNDGEITGFFYTPREHFNGTDMFIYTVTDDGTSVEIGTDLTEVPDRRIATNTVLISVKPVNDPPLYSGPQNVNVIEDGNYSSPPEGTPIENWATNILAGPPRAEDEQDQVLQFEIVLSPEDQALFAEQPTAVIDPETKTASLHFVPALNANGTVLATAVLTDTPTDGTDPESISRAFTITIDPVNDAPTYEIAEGLEFVQVDEDSGPYTATWAEEVSPGPADESEQTVRFDVAVPAHQQGLFQQQPQINVNAADPNNMTGELRFIPALHANGLVNLMVTAIDSEGAASEPFALDLLIAPVNDAPTAVADELSSNEDIVLTIPSSTLLSNDIDPDLGNPSDTLSIDVNVLSPLTQNGALVTYDETTGNFTYNPTFSDAIQSLPPYQPALIINGQEVIPEQGRLVDSFTYRAIDLAGATSNIVTVAITIDGVNDAPVAVDDSPTLNADGPTIIRAFDNDFDIDGDVNPSTFEITSQPAFGTLELGSDDNGDTIVIYRASSVFTTQDTFKYQVADNLGVFSNEATVRVLANAAPILIDDRASTYVDEPVIVDVADNDSDPDGSLDLTSIEITSPASRGTAVPLADGTVRYIPSPTFTGIDTFQYIMADDDGRLGEAATVTINVIGSRLQNPVLQEDVSGDGNVTPLDALLVINRLASSGSLSIPVTELDSGPAYYDVNGDQTVGLRDALDVINYLTRQASGQTEQIPTPAPVQDEVIQLLANDIDDDDDKDDHVSAVDAAFADLA